MKTFEQCLRKVGEEKGYPKDVVEMYVADWLTEAAHLYAKDKLKGLLEVAKQEAAQWQTKSDKENDISNKAAYSMTAYAVNRIATRIEEMIGENTNNETK